MTSNFVKPFLWNRVTNISIDKRYSDASEQFTKSANEESHSSIIDLRDV
jgi:hypothetical protein